VSRVAKEPIAIPGGVKVDIRGGSIAVNGPKGNLDMKLNSLVKVTDDEGKVKVTARNSSVKSRAMSGTMRSLINNMVTGVSEGYQVGLVLVGTGYRAKANGSELDLSLGYSHPIKYVAPDSVKFEIKSESSSQVELAVYGIDKQQIGQVAADIRRMRPPEPYKGKGVRYANEQIRRKQAKSVA